MKYIREIDAARGVLIILVVAIHVASFMIWYNPSPNIDSYFWFFAFGKFSVPGFILLSGLVLSYSFREKKLSYIDFIKTRMIYIIVPYLAWSGIYFLVKTPETVTNGLVLLIKGKAMFHLYFVVIIFQFYVLLPLFLKIINSIAVKLFVVIGLLLQLTIYDLFPTYSFLRPLNPSIFLLWFYVFTIGLYIGKEYENVMGFIDKNGGLIMSLFVISTLSTFMKFHFSIEKGIKVWQSADSMPIIMTISSVLFILYIARKYNIVQDLFNTIGKHSFSIYLAHMVPLILVKPIFKTLSITVTDLVATMLLVTTVITSLAFSIFVKKILGPRSALLIGK